jgi:putative phosphoribosyl transferase
VFRDRDHAGRLLADRVKGEGLQNPLVLALPRGGVPVAAAVAAALNAPLAAFVARKIGAPGQPEFGIGAIAEGSDEVLVTSDARRLGLDDRKVSALADAERAELDRRVRLYRNGQPLPPLAQRDVVLVDDGLATGVTAEAALRALRRLGPRRLVLAAPVAAPDTARRLDGIADDLVFLSLPKRLGAVGMFYEDFAQTTDEEVLALLGRYGRGRETDEETS